MNTFSQGDIVKIEGFKNYFLIVSKNAFIKATGVFHVCPILTNTSEGPLHIMIDGVTEKKSGVVICEQIKFIDPSARGISIADRISYTQLMNVSDAIQGVFEYD